MDLSVIAARVATEYASTAGKCAQCGGDLSAEEVASATCSKCHTGPPSPATVLAARKPAPKRPGMLRPETEYSVNVELSLTADFEGSSSKNKLLKKLQSELTAAIKEAVATTSRELGLRSTGVVLKPIEVGVAVTDLSSPDDEDEPEDYEEPEEPRRRRKR